MQPYFDKMPWFAARAAAEHSAPLFPGATRFGKIGTNIADQEKRWDDWIVPFLWPEWETFSTAAASANWIKFKMDFLKNPKR